MNLVVALTFAISFSFLSYASYKDIKTREVSNWVWVFYGTSSLFMAAVIYTTQNPFAIMFYIINLAVTVIIAVAMWQIGFYGGADTKALICVGFAHATSLLVFAFTTILMFGAYLRKKKENLPLIPFMTLALAFVLIQVLLV